MNISTQQSAAINHTAYPGIPPHSVYLTVEQFSGRHPAFSSASLRNLIFKAGERESTKGKIPGNGLVQAGAIVRVGRKVLLVEDRFFNWIDEQNGGAK